MHSATRARASPRTAVSHNYKVTTTQVRLCSEDDFQVFPVTKLPGTTFTTSVVSSADYNDYCVNPTYFDQRIQPFRVLLL